MARASGGRGGRGHRKRASRWRDRDDRLALFSRSGRQSRRSQQPGRSPMSDTLLTVLQYYGAGAATFAALLVSLNLGRRWTRSEEHTSELQSLMPTSYAVFRLKK